MYSKNFEKTIYEFFNLESEWMFNAYNEYRDIEKYLILIYLIHRTLETYNKHFYKVDFKDFYNSSHIEIEKISIIDLVKTAVCMNSAYKWTRNAARSGKRFLFVGTKKQASEVVAMEAARCGASYVNQRWLGGMLTNWGTISNSIKKLNKINVDLSSENRGFTKKELLKMSGQRDKLSRSLGGIAEMKKIPDLVFVIDTNYESLALKESIKLVFKNKTTKILLATFFIGNFSFFTIPVIYPLIGIEYFDLENPGQMLGFFIIIAD